MACARGGGPIETSCHRHPPCRHPPCRHPRHPCPIAPPCRIERPHARARAGACLRLDGCPRSSSSRSPAAEEARPRGGSRERSRGGSARTQVRRGASWCIARASLAHRSRQSLTSSLSSSAQSLLTCERSRRFLSGPRWSLRPDWIQSRSLSTTFGSAFSASEVTRPRVDPLRSYLSTSCQGDELGRGGRRGSESLTAKIGLHSASPRAMTWRAWRARHRGHRRGVVMPSSNDHLLVSQYASARSGACACVWPCIKSSCGGGAGTPACR